MKKMIVLVMVSLSLIACDEGSSDSSKGPVFGLDFEYDGSHPEGITVDENGKLKPFVIDAADVVNECGKDFYKSDETGDIFYAEEVEGQWKAKQIGFYHDYDNAVGGFQIVGYNRMQIVSVGKYVAISAQPGLTEYYDWTRTNWQHIESHDNCMVIIDEMNQDVLAVDLSNDETTSIF